MHKGLHTIIFRKFGQRGIYVHRLPKNYTFNGTRPKNPEILRGLNHSENLSLKNLRQLTWSCGWSDGPQILFTSAKSRGWDPIFDIVRLFGHAFSYEPIKINFRPLC